MARPNLFHYATSELSQDAVLCWLAEWARPEAAAADARMHSLGLEFLAALFAAHDRTLPEISAVDVKRQHKRIDVLLTINHQWMVCIEDKAGSREHSDQLPRYVEELKAEGVVPPAHILPVYLQTFEQGDYEAVREAGYKTISRKQLLSLLRPYAASLDGNAIICDFYDHLSAVDRKFEGFREQPFAKWDDFSWQGFYCELRQRIPDGKWIYVPNPSGGFQCFWWYVKEDSGYLRYLQLEEKRLCFKLEVEQPQDRGVLRDRWQQLLLEEGQAQGYGVVRPSRSRAALSMTAAVFKSDYRVENDEGHLDLDATVAELRKAETVFAGALAREAS